MKDVYHNLKFVCLICVFVIFYFIALKPIGDSYLEGFKTNNFSKFNRIMTRRFTLGI